MTDPKTEFAAMRRELRYYKRQSRASMLAFVIAVGLLAFATFQNVSYRDALNSTMQVMEKQAEEIQDVDAMVHYIRTLQGRLNACRAEQGLPSINFEKY